MENEMIIINKMDLTNLITQLKTFNENFEKINFNKQSEKFLTRAEVAEQYELSQREVAKIFNKLLKDKIVNIGKTQKLAKSHIDELFTKGVVLKGM